MYLVYNYIGDTGAGVWAVYPVIFSISYFHGVFHLAITVILSICTLSSFCLSAFQPAGVPPIIIWGSYPAVGQGGLRNYTFCHYCSKPKSPLVHHCRSCGTCVLGMDHHCPFVSLEIFFTYVKRFMHECIYNWIGIIRSLMWQLANNIIFVEMIYGLSCKR